MLMGHYFLLTLRYAKDITWIYNPYAKVIVKCLASHLRTAKMFPLPFHSGTEHKFYHSVQGLTSIWTRNHLHHILGKLTIKDYDLTVPSVNGSINMNTDIRRTSIVRPNLERLVWIWELELWRSQNTHYARNSHAHNVVYSRIRYVQRNMNLRI